MRADADGTLDVMCRSLLALLPQANNNSASSSTSSVETGRMYHDHPPTRTFLNIPVVLTAVPLFRRAHVQLHRDGGDAGAGVAHVPAPQHPHLRQRLWPPHPRQHLLVGPARRYSLSLFLVTKRTFLAGRRNVPFLTHVRSLQICSRSCTSASRPAPT